MAYSGGTIAAQNCIAKLTDLGALVDIYSNKWLEENPDNSYFDADDLVEYQGRSNGACNGHLLVISTSLHLQKVSELLLGVHPAFATCLGEKSPYHKPDLIFINLATKQILCVGLGRKNYFFGTAIHEEDVKVSDGNVKELTRTNTDSTSHEPALVYMREFIKYDYANVVQTLIDALYEFGVCARNWDQLPLTPDQIEEIIDQGPDDDGMYDIDDQLMSLEDARGVIAEFEEINDWGKENLSTIQAFFPDLEWADLNTQDY